MSGTTLGDHLKVCSECSQIGAGGVGLCPFGRRLYETAFDEWKRSVEQSMEVPSDS